jgi:hypothetical protein
MEQIKISMEDFICGITTGIPICCITWYASEWVRLDRNARDIHWLGMSKKMDEIQYIPCPVCGKRGNFVDIWLCPGSADCKGCQTGGFRERIKKPRKYGMRRASEIYKKSQRAKKIPNQ